MNLNSKTMLVTGASDGIGKEIAIRLAQDAKHIILLARGVKKLEQVATAVQKEGSKATVISCDLENVSEITEAVSEIENEIGTLDVIVNNAGVWQKLQQLDEMTDEMIISVLNVNLQGMILLTKYVLPLLRDQDEAAIINISSRSGYSAQAGQAVYTASKYGVRGFTEVLQNDLKESAVRVAGVYQGGTNTKMFEKAGEDWPQERYDRFIPPSGIADVIAFMLSRPEQVWLPEVRIESK